MHVSEVIPYSPAALSGSIRPGDIIYEIDTQSVDQLTVVQMTQLLHGAPGSPILLTVSAPPTYSLSLSRPSSAVASATGSGTTPRVLVLAKSPQPPILPQGGNSRIPSVDPASFRTVSIRRGAAGTLGMKFARAESIEMGPYEVIECQNTAIVPGDLIFQVDEWNVTELQIENVTSLMRGLPGSVCQIYFVHPGESKQTPQNTQAAVVTRRKHGDPVDIKVTMDLNFTTTG